MLEYHNKEDSNEHVTFEHENINVRKTLTDQDFI